MLNLKSTKLVMHKLVNCNSYNCNINYTDCGMWVGFNLFDTLFIGSDQKYESKGLKIILNNRNMMVKRKTVDTLEVNQWNFKRIKDIDI